MKKTPLLNAPLSEVIASMGHGDKLVICDCGLPIPSKTYTIDLAVTRNIPGFMDVLETTLKELEVEQAFIAGEMEKNNPTIFERTREVLAGIPISDISHEDLKKKIRDDADIVVVRTGEASPYANIILQSGVTF